MKDQSNFIKTIMENDLESGKHDLIITRFPPEPNGYLHIGHARAIIINFELAKHFEVILTFVLTILTQKKRKLNSLNLLKKT